MLMLAVTLAFFHLFLHVRDLHQKGPPAARGDYVGHACIPPASNIAINSCGAHTTARRQAGDVMMWTHFQDPEGHVATGVGQRYSYEEVDLHVIISADWLASGVVHNRYLAACFLQ